MIEHSPCAPQQFGVEEGKGGVSIPLVEQLESPGV